MSVFLVHVAYLDHPQFLQGVRRGWLTTRALLTFLHLPLPDPRSYTALSEVNERGTRRSRRDQSVRLYGIQVYNGCLLTSAVAVAAAADDALKLVDMDTTMT